MAYRGSRSIGERRISITVPLPILFARSSARWKQGVGTADIEEAQFDEEVRRQTVTGGEHHIGTARMADESRDGVVMPDCVVHGTANLYVAGAAVFPTSGQAIRR
jgi:choline dehydrogenase-like flavoprotein